MRVLRGGGGVVGEVGLRAGRGDVSAQISGECSDTHS